MALMDHFPSNIGSFGNHGTNWPDRDEEPDYDALSGFAHLGRGWVDGLLDRIAIRSINYLRVYLFIIYCSIFDV